MCRCHALPTDMLKHFNPIHGLPACVSRRTDLNLNRDTYAEDGSGKPLTAVLSNPNNWLTRLGDTFIGFHNDRGVEYKAKPFDEADMARFNSWNTTGKSEVVVKHIRAPFQLPEIVALPLAK